MIDALSEFHIGQGTDAATLGKEIEQFLTVDGWREQTQTPYGSKGFHAPLMNMRQVYNQY